MGTTTISSSGYQFCNWPRSGPFCWQNPCSGCNSGFDLVVVLEYTFFQLCAAPRKSLRFTRFIRSYLNRPAVVLTNHCQSYTAFFLNVSCSKLLCSIFCRCLFPMTVQLRYWAYLLLECCELQGGSADEQMSNSYEYIKFNSWSEAFHQAQNNAFS